MTVRTRKRVTRRFGHAGKEERNQKEENEDGRILTHGTAATEAAGRELSAVAISRCTENLSQFDQKVCSYKQAIFGERTADAGIFRQAQLEVIRNPSLFHDGVRGVA
ncbi:MAG TPA: hypothetical protein VMF32_16920 [Xanthobacteraceae bacterium]|nr:hypothetical protein [Xanthobacteraceae bacterium]